MSVRLSSAFPRACSGLMYAAVPRTTPSCVVAAVIVGEIARSTGRRIAGQCLGQAEVEHLHGAVGPQLDVGRLQVAMDDTPLMRRLERVRDLLRDRQSLFRGIGPCAMRSASVGPSTSSSTSARSAAGFLETVNRAMFGWFRTARTCASRANRARRSASPAKSVRQNLQRDVAAEFPSRAR